MSNLKSMLTMSVVGAALLTACATTQMEAQWTNPDYSGRNVRGSVLIACEAQDLTLQRICEDQVAAAVAAQGAKPVMNSQMQTAPAPGTGPDPYIAAAKRIGAGAIVRTTLVAGPAVVSGGPSIGIGIGGFGGGYGRGGVSGGVGVSTPVGGSTVAQGLLAETALIDSSNGAVMWSGRASSPSNRDATTQIAELAQTTVQAIQQAKLL